MATNPKTVEATGRVYAGFRDRHGIDGDEAWKQIDGALAAFLMERTGRIDSELQHMPPGARLGALIDTYGEVLVNDGLERFARGELTLPEPTRDNNLQGWGVVSAAGRTRGYGSPEGAIRAFIVAPAAEAVRVYHDGQVVVDLDPEDNLRPLFADDDVRRVYEEVSAQIEVEEKKRLPREPETAPETVIPEHDDFIHYVVVDNDVGRENEDAIVGVPSMPAEAPNIPNNTELPSGAGAESVADAIAKGPERAPVKDAGTPIQESDGKRKDLGPLNLHNGLFERDEAGQYRRVGEEKISLIDEGLRIRMLDKQEDAFLASIELAAAKGWKTIEVTGSPKFRAEAWLNAKLAGFEVVGYTPTELDLVSLEASREGKGVVATPESLMKSKAAAEAVAKIKCVKVADADNEKGRYSGPLILVTEHHAVQDIGRKTAVVHELKKLPQAEVERALTGKRSLSVEYQGGIVFAKARAPLAQANER